MNRDEFFARLARLLKMPRTAIRHQRRSSATSAIPCRPRLYSPHPLPAEDIRRPLDYIMNFLLNFQLFRS
jgi:hypothetical protein